MPDHVPLSSPTARSSVAPSSQRAGDIAPIVRTLESVRRRAWVLLLVGGLAGIVGIAGVTVWTAGVIDFYLRGPMTLRLGLLIAAIAGLWVLVRRRLGPVVTFRPTLTELALRIEGTQEAARAGLRGVLASGLELAGRAPDAGTDGARAGLAVDEALARFEKSRAAAQVLRLNSTSRALGLALVLILPGLVIAAWKPALAGIGLERILMPWTDAAWPKRTALADATGLLAHSSRASLPVRAVVKHVYGEGYTPDVWVRFRTVVDGVAGAWRRELLTPQGRTATSPDGSLEGDLVERLIEPGLGEAGRGASATSRVEMEYAFSSTDDQTEVQKIRLVEPPVIVRADVEVELPSYAVAPARAGGTAAAFVSGKQELAEGASIATVGTVLAGSRVTVRAGLNKPVAAPPTGTARLFSGEPPVDAQMSARGAEWTVGFTAERSTRLTLLPEDEFGISSPAETVVSLTVLPDQPPSAAVLTPAQDEGVLPTASVGVVGEGRDDVALAWASVEYQLIRGAAGSQGAPGAGEPAATLANSADRPGESGLGIGTESRVEATLKLESLGAKAGDEVVLKALAKDVFSRAGAEHEAVASSPRRLLVISEAQLIEQVQSELAAVRDSAIRLDRDQEDLTKRAAQQTTGQQESAQRSITQRLAPPAELVERLSQRIERNGLTDRALSGMLKDAAETLRAAAEDSQKAAEDLSRADRKTAAGEDPAGDAAQARKDQDQVRDELGRVVGMLDRGQDSWTVRREVQRLLGQQKELLDQTREAGKATAGKAGENLTPQEREKLSALAQKQQDLSSRTEAAIDSLEQRARALEKSDPGQSAAMKQAAQQAREQKVTPSQRQAAQAINENRTRSANELQEQAAKALEQMLQKFDQSEKQRDEALRRVLAQLVEQIGALVGQQQAAVQALADAGANPGGKGLDAGMIALRGATLGLADSVREGARGARAIAQPLESAAESQDRAISELRGHSPSAENTRVHEQASLSRLNEALDLARKLEDQAGERDQGRQRGELLEAYRSALEEQSVVAVETGPLVGNALDRRQRATARALGEREEALRGTLAELRKKNGDIDQTVVFSYAHDQLDVMLKRSGDSLRAGAASKGVQRDQSSAIALLKSLVQALASNPQVDPFREGADEGADEQQGGGGGGGGGKPPKLIPEIAELQGLRGLQEIAGARTKAASESGADATAEEIGDLQKFQRELADKAKQLVDRLNNPEGDKPAPGEGDPGREEPPKEPSRPEDPATNKQGAG